jgi:thiol-disulfide isomerase/thioredoxin
MRACAAWLVAAGVGLAGAGEVPYEEARFEAALAQRGGFVVALVADWCTTCNRQEVVVTELLAEPRFKGLTLLVADYDREAKLRQRLRVALQGTFVVFKNGREVARSTGVTDKAALAALFAKAL